MGLLTRSANGTLELCHNYVLTEEAKDRSRASADAIKLHSQVLQMAANSLKTRKRSELYVYGITMAIKFKSGSARLAMAIAQIE